MADHVVVYITNKAIRAVSFKTSPIAPVGKAYDGVGDHQGMIVDLQYSHPEPPLKSQQQTPPRITTPELSVAKVVTSWVPNENYGGGYLPLTLSSRVTVLYNGPEGGNEEGWTYGESRGSVGWFPTLCIQSVPFKVSADWTTTNGGHMSLEKGDIIEGVYTGTAGDEVGRMFGVCGDASGWFPEHCVLPWSW